MDLNHTSALFAQDFKDALSDLRTNDKYKIHNLTMIANDNTNHAEAIALALEEHIKTAPVSRKLWALYLLDSIVKNVGSPYTNLLGRNLFSIFMSAYQRVGDDVRRSMEAMLKTWREPVPGAMSSTPVFPDYATRNIENALLKARTAFVQQQHEQARAQRQVHGLPPRPPTTDQSWSNAPTTQINGAGYGPPPPPGYQNGAFPPQNSYPPVQAYPSHPPAPPPQTYGPPSWAQYPHPTPPPGQSFERAPGVQVDDQARLSKEVDNLISAANAQVAMRSWDVGVQERLRNLLALQRILNNSQLHPDQLRAIQDQVAPSNSRGQGHTLPPVPPPPATHTPNGYPHMIPRSPPQPPPQSLVPSSAPPPPQTPLSLSAILAATKSGKQPPSTNSQAQPQPQPPQTGHNTLGLPGMPNNIPQSNDLISQLRAGGWLPPATPEARTTSAANAVNGSIYPPPPLPATATGPPRTHHTKPRNDVELTNASVKIPRPHLIASLYNARPSQCSTCGRRFATDATGKARKARHLDYHFRTNRRLAESTRSSVNRAWYVDEMEWIRFREIDDADEAPDPAKSPPPSHNGAGRGGGAAADAGRDGVGERVSYVKAPADAVARDQACPICQERFETLWLDEMQEFVWGDAVDVGGRVFHKSCRDEVSRDSATPAPNGGGPGGGLKAVKAEVKNGGAGLSPVLGKRKMEADDDDEEYVPCGDFKRRLSGAGLKQEIST